jgi:hypothetical protein
MTKRKTLNLKLSSESNLGQAKNQQIIINNPGDNPYCRSWFFNIFLRR